MSESIYMAEPPKGLLRNEEKPPNMHLEISATGVSVVVLAAMAVSLRIFTRVSITKNGIAWDDYTILIALAFAIAMLGVSFEHMQYGLGYHYWDVKTVDFAFGFQVATLSNTIFYATSLAFTKVSILLFYLRLSPHIWFRVLVRILLGIVVTYAIVYDLLSIFACKPIAASWDLRLAPTATCIDTLTKYMALSVLNIIIDVFTLVLPIPVVVGLQMSVRQKISIILIFLTGGFVCVIALRRTILLRPLMVSTDYTWDAVEQYQWCFAEVNAAIICASAPALRPFFMKYVPSLLKSRFGSSHQHNGYVENSNDLGSRALETISQKRSRKVSIMDAYELNSRDYIEEGRTKDGHVDDEARLWDGKKR
ncbi:hypothetical protein P280DRAFT_452571 [Massarina eburnea CBS 473.64]|uniref:Rhodopsin domain-containing protein n=1 Tax=Massarina eburnea CBS 473.64 TaxID=1395130 RepID=A0A6A6RY47_9PLEO|nr:hypothetical protein P280DRAFT_452571 [Massarina eburnea CBS 473.64]